MNKKRFSFHKIFLGIAIALGVQANTQAMTSIYKCFKPAISLVGNNKKKVILGLAVGSACIIYRYRKQIGNKLVGWLAPLFYTPQEAHRSDINDFQAIIRNKQKFEIKAMQKKTEQDQ